MSENLARCRAQSAKIRMYFSRSGCAPCDRSEAGFQLAKINTRIDQLNELLLLLTDGQQDQAGEI